MRDDVTEDVKEETVKGEVFPILIAKLETNQGNVLVWSGIGNLEFNGEIYYGTGDMGSISPVKESGDEIRANSVNFQLSGIPSERISVALGAEYQGKPAKLWLGFMDGEDLIADPILLFSGRMDVMLIDEGPETSTITVTAESKLADLKRSRIRRYTDEDQQVDYPGDKFFEFVPSIQNIEVVWKGN
jgi:hypothetical protein